MSIAPGGRIGPYQVVSLLGRGGMGEVFLANDTRLHRQVVLKTPDPLGGATEMSAGMPTISSSGRVVGTPGYAPPEQLMGRDVDDRSDIYSLGVLLFELCTGRLPLDGSEALEIEMASVKDPALVAHDVEPTVPVELSAIIGRAMETEPSARYQSAELMRAALRRLHVPASERPTERRPIVERPTGAPPPVQTVPIRVARRRTLLAATAVAMIVALGWLATRPESPPLCSRTVTIAPIVGVLPFTNAGDDAADEHLGIGMADLLISALDRMPAISVVSGSATLGI